MAQDGPRGRVALLALHDLLAAADRAIESNDHTAARYLLERAGATLESSGPRAAEEPPSKKVEVPTTLNELRVLLDAVGQSVEEGDLAGASDLLELLRDTLRASRPPPAAEPPRSVSGFRFLGRRKDAK